MGVSHQPPVLLLSKMVPSFSLTYRRAIKEVSKAVNLDWSNNQACRLSQNIYVMANLFITNNYLFEMIRKINFTNYFSEFIHQMVIKFRFWKALQKKCFQSDIIFRHYVKMPPINLWKRLTKFLISIPLSEKFCCQNLITSIKVINMTRNSSKSNKLRNINTIGCRTRNITI